MGAKKRNRKAGAKKRKQSASDEDQQEHTSKGETSFWGNIMDTLTRKKSRPDQNAKPSDDNKQYETKSLEYILGMDTTKRIQIMNYLPGYHQLKSLVIGSDTPLYCTVLATESLIRGAAPHLHPFLLESTYIPRSYWARIFPGCTIAINRRATHDLNDYNLRLFCTCITKNSATTNTATRIHHGSFYGRDCLFWPLLEDTKCFLPNESLVTGALSDTGMEKLVNDFDTFIRRLFPDFGGFGLMSTEGCVFANGYDQFSSPDPLCPDRFLYLKPRIGGEKYFILTEEHKRLSVGLGADIMRRYSKYHGQNMRNVNRSLSQFYRWQGIGTPRVCPDTFYLVMHQALSQAFGLKCRNVAVTDGSVYMAVHIAGEQDIGKWPDNAPPAIVKQMSSDNETTSWIKPTMEEWESFPRVNVDAISIFTNEEAFMKYRTTLIINELFRMFPNLKALCEKFLHEGDTAAQEYANTHRLEPDSSYMNECSTFWDRIVVISHRRIINIALQCTQHFSVIDTSELEVLKVIRGDPPRDRGKCKLYEIKWKGNNYILKTYPLLDIGIENYCHEVLCYEVGQRKNVDVMVKAIATGRINRSQRFEFPDSGFCEVPHVEDLKLEGKSANEDAPFFIILEIAKGRPADPHNPEHVKAVGSALNILKKAGIEHSNSKNWSNFFIDRNSRVKIIDFADPHPWVGDDKSSEVWSED